MSEKHKEVKFERNGDNIMEVNGNIPLNDLLNAVVSHIISNALLESVLKTLTNSDTFIMKEMGKIMDNVAEIFSKIGEYDEKELSKEIDGLIIKIDNNKKVEFTKNSKPALLNRETGIWLIASLVKNAYKDKGAEFTFEYVKNIIKKIINEIYIKTLGDIPITNKGA
jgi:ABC-type enterochelin transport system substrate-binding protein